MVNNSIVVDRSMGTTGQTGLSTIRLVQAQPHVTPSAHYTMADIPDRLDVAQTMYRELQGAFRESGSDLNILWRQPFLQSLYNFQLQLGSIFADVKRGIWLSPRQSDLSIGTAYQLLDSGGLGVITFALNVNHIIDPNDRKVVFEYGMKLARGDLYKDTFSLIDDPSGGTMAFQVYMPIPIKHTVNESLDFFNADLSTNILGCEISETLRTQLSQIRFNPFLIYTDEVSREHVSTHVIQGGMLAADIRKHPMIHDIRSFQLRMMARTLSVQWLANNDKLQQFSELMESGLARGDLLERHLDQGLRPAFEERVVQTERSLKMRPFDESFYGKTLSKLARISSLSGVAFRFLDREVGLHTAISALNNIRSELVRLSNPNAVRRSSSFRAAILNFQLQHRRLELLLQEELSPEERREVGVRASLPESLEILRSAPSEIEIPERAAG